jgi:hypothetical protein
MKLPKNAIAVVRYGVSSSSQKINQSSGVLPSANACQIACRATQLAEVASCKGDPICTVLAVANGEKCFSDC